jgi:hypothetical protein
MVPMAMSNGTTKASPTHHSGRRFTTRELALVREVVETCSGLSRTELARTVCELVGWKRAAGGLKAQECLEFLERLEGSGTLALPAKQPRRPVGSRTHVPVTARGERGRDLVGDVADYAPIEVEAVETPDQRLLFRELVGRYHYLGHAVPFGAHLRYLVLACKPQRTVVGCIQFSSPAWRMAARDAWIGWDDATRERNLQRVVNNSRFLILPWVRITNLASSVLSAATRCVKRDWPHHYAVEPLLVETLVDTSRYRGHCYLAANWICVGQTTGRGRMDREHLRHGQAIKTVWVYPLVKGAAQRLRQG